MRPGGNGASPGNLSLLFPIVKGAVHILGEICPRSDPDIAKFSYVKSP